MTPEEKLEKHREYNKIHRLEINKRNREYKHKNIEEVHKRNKLYNDNHLPQKRAYNKNWVWQKLLKNYGITLEQYNQMFVDQNGVCKICGQPELTKRLAVDHNHITGKIRGLLCTRCNTAIGLFKENISIIEGAVRYLRNENK